jgi:hypothetical protein
LFEATPQSHGTRQIEKLQRGARIENQQLPADVI